MYLLLLTAVLTILFFMFGIFIVLTTITTVIIIFFINMVYIFIKTFVFFRITVFPLKMECDTVSEQKNSIIIKQQERLFCLTIVWRACS